MYRIFGPPGTGKTTTLLNMVDKALESGTPPDHSLALTMSDIRPEQVMQEENYRELSRAIGVELGAQKNTSIDDDVPSMVASSDPILGLINLSRLCKSDLREEYNKSNIDEEWNTVFHVSKCLKEYKESMGLYDFTDMLEQFATNGNTFCPDFDLCFLDEAQDLSPLQWDIAHLLDTKSKRMYCAGDDDQAIYRWAGADVDHFINLPGGSEILSQSYRIPSRVHDVAENVVRRIARRFPKQYKPRSEPGNVTRISTINSLDMAQGDWLILSQAGYQLTPVAHDLKSSGYLFNYRGNRSISEKVSEAVNGWEQVRKGKEVTGKVARIIYSYMSVGERLTRGFKKLPGIEDNDILTFDNLKDQGLLANKDMIWSQAMNKLPDTDRAYVTALLRRGEKFNGVPRITASTIHGSKGGEADNVVLFTDLSPAADTQFQRHPDDTHRIFYVAVTRAKQNLYIVDAEDVSRSYDL